MGKTFERGMTVTICSFHGTNSCHLVNTYPVFYLLHTYHLQYMLAHNATNVNCQTFKIFTSLKYLLFIAECLYIFSFGIQWVEWVGVGVGNHRSPPNAMPMHFLCL